MKRENTIETNRTKLARAIAILAAAWIIALAASGGKAAFADSGSTMGMGTTTTATTMTSAETKTTANGDAGSAVTCRLSLVCASADGTQAIAGERFDVYKVADENGKLTERFAGIGNADDEASWAKAAAAAVAGTDADGTMTSDNAGRAGIELASGRYLVVGEDANIAGAAWNAVPLLVTLDYDEPTLRTVTAYVKYALPDSGDKDGGDKNDGTDGDGTNGTGTDGTTGKTGGTNGNGTGTTGSSVTSWLTKTGDAAPVAWAVGAAAAAAAVTAAICRRRMGKKED